MIQAVDYLGSLGAALMWLPQTHRVLAGTVYPACATVIVAVVLLARNSTRRCSAG